MTRKTIHDVTVPFPSDKPVYQLTIPEGTEVKYIPPHPGLPTPGYAVARLRDLTSAGAASSIAEYHFCWLPADAIGEEDSE